jgi:hypothetical protein
MVKVVCVLDEDVWVTLSLSLSLPLLHLKTSG